MAATILSLPPERLRLLALAGVAGLLVAGLGWRAGSPGPVSGVAPRNTGAAPLEWAPYNAADDMMIIAARHPWGKEAPKAGPAAGPAAAPPPAWRLGGIIDKDGKRAALIAIKDAGKERFVTLAVGDKLPDGRVLVAIDATSITAQAEDGTRETFQMFSNPGGLVAGSAQAPASRPASAGAPGDTPAPPRRIPPTPPSTTKPGPSTGHGKPGH